MKNARKRELNEKWKKIAIQAVTQEDFKDKLNDDPIAVMKEFGLEVPEGAEAKIGTGQVVKLTMPSDASDDIKDEVQWWRWRLDMIREFGKEEPETGVKQVAPETEEGV